MNIYSEKRNKNNKSQMTYHADHQKNFYYIN